jgi:hypothetical protein
MPAKDFGAIVYAFTSSREQSLALGYHFVVAEVGDGISDIVDRNLQIDVGLEPFLTAMTELARIFDAIGSQFVAEFLRKDVLCKLAVIRAASTRYEGADSVRRLVESETNNPPTGFFCPTPAIPALQWLTRVLHFIEELVSGLVNNPSLELSEAALHAYRKSLWVCHPAFTRTIFESALGYVPKREKFESDIGDSETDVAKSFAVFVSEVKPHLRTMRYILQ